MSYCTWQSVLKFNFQKTDDESEKQMAMPSTEGQSSNIVSEELMIEIPLSSGSRIFKMKVSLADFCKLPIRDIGIDSNETSSRNTNIVVMPLLNSSFCTQISSTASTTSGDKGTPWIRTLMVTDLRVIETNLCYWHMRTKFFDFLGAILQIRKTEQKVHL